MRGRGGRKVKKYGFRYFVDESISRISVQYMINIGKYMTPIIWELRAFHWSALSD